jgi:type II secretory pathway predicted ATPase ExeA
MAIVPGDVLRAVLDDERQLSREQREAIRQLCRSGHRIQCMVGPAGSGKTATVRAAARVWNPK